MAKRMRVIPKNLKEAAMFLVEIGKEQRLIEEIKSDYNAEMEKLKAKLVASINPHQERLLQLIKGIFAYAEAHRNELTNGGRCKTVKTPTGVFGWRMTPPAVSLHNVKSVLEVLKRLNLKRFIRVKEEINKEAILKEPNIAKKVKGIFIRQDEEFFVKPAILEVEIANKTNKFKSKKKL